MITKQNKQKIGSFIINKNMKICPVAACQFNRGFTNVVSVCDLDLNDLTQCKIYRVYQEAKKK